jgi:surfactin/lichenysin synthetase A
MSDSSIEGFPVCTETEKEILLIWRDVLRRREIDLHETFLDLGGDSLSAMLCMSRLRKIFGIELQLEDFFLDNATISAIADMIDKKDQATSQ